VRRLTRLRDRILYRVTGRLSLPSAS